MIFRKKRTLEDIKRDILKNNKYVKYGETVQLLLKDFGDATGEIIDKEIRETEVNNKVFTEEELERLERLKNIKMVARKLEDVTNTATLAYTVGKIAKDYCDENIK